MGSAHLEMKCHETAVVYFRVKNIIREVLAVSFYPLLLHKLSGEFNSDQFEGYLNIFPIVYNNYYSPFALSCRYSVIIYQCCLYF